MTRKQSSGSVARPPLGEMSPEELRSWVRHTREALQRKMRREQAYVARRAARGVWTPTDDALEADQVLEADLLAMLDEMEQAVSQQA